MLRSFRQSQDRHSGQSVNLTQRIKANPSRNTLALFYAGMVRRKNVLSTTMHALSAIPVISVA